MRANERGWLERKRSTEAHAVVALESVVGFDGSRIELQRKVGTDVEDRQLRIYIGIESREEIDTNKANDGEIAIASESVFTIAEHGFELFQSAVDVVGGGKEVAKTIGERIVVHDVEIGLRIVHIHLLIPQESIGST